MATKRSVNLGCTLISQRLSFFVAGSDVNHGQRKLVSAAVDMIVWQMQKISLMTALGESSSNIGRGMCRAAGKYICQMACRLSQSRAICSETFGAVASFLIAASPRQ